MIVLDNKDARRPPQPWRKGEQAGAKRRDAFAPASLDQARRASICLCMIYFENWFRFSGSCTS
jgi:hypothetical protein